VLRHTDPAVQKVLFFLHLLDLLEIMTSKKLEIPQVLFNKSAPPHRRGGPTSIAVSNIFWTFLKS